MFKLIAILILIIGAIMANHVNTYNMWLLYIITAFASMVILYQDYKITIISKHFQREQWFDRYRKWINW